MEMTQGSYAQQLLASFLQNQMGNNASLPMQSAPELSTHPSMLPQAWPTAPHPLEVARAMAVQKAQAELQAALRPPPGLEHVKPSAPTSKPCAVPMGRFGDGTGKARQISKSSMSTAAEQEAMIEELSDLEEVDSNCSSPVTATRVEASPGPGSVIHPAMAVRSFDAALRQLIESVPRLARDSKGALLLAQHVSAMDAQGLGLMIAALRPLVVELGCDASGTGVVQQLFTSCSEHPSLRAQLSESLGGSILKMSKDKHGCLVIQHALGMAPVEMQSLIGPELRGKVFYCSRHMHGNFVMQKIIQVLPTSALTFILAELKETVVAAALHIYACRVLQRLIEHCGHRPELLDLLQDLMVPGEQLQRLVKDPYSSNVIRTLVVCGNVEYTRLVMRLFSEDVMKYSRNRHASLVLEKCLEVSAGPKACQLTQERAALMTAFFSPSTRSTSPPLLQIMLDRFGNYIVQRVIETSHGAEKDEASGET
ncbi:APUM2 [Symbiodinium natans]|uniref:APUM2 protein n=1 Tax=Symbiodinium natans TaxID=878477 RepID=A0A812TJG8_9DINO|nr:APUM2 [Symbiodinium natans]